MIVRLLSHFDLVYFSYPAAHSGCYCSNLGNAMDFFQLEIFWEVGIEAEDFFLQ